MRVPPHNTHVITACDDAYVQHLAVMIASLLDMCACPGSVTIHVLHDGLAVEYRELLRASTHAQGAGIEFLEGYAFDATPVAYRYLSPATYYRLDIGSMLPDVQQAVYLDADIVVRRDISELAAKETGPWLAWAVHEPVRTDNILHRLGMPDPQEYFNAGVMLMNLEQWREEEIGTRARKLIAQHHNTIQHDQDVLNVLLHGKWARLHPRWNQTRGVFRVWKSDRVAYSQDELKVCKEDPAIVHFTGVLKPWHAFDDHPFRAEYYHYLQKTPWRNSRPTWRLNREQRRAAAARCMHRLMSRVLPARVYYRLVAK